jgi:hypothetical protein
VKENQKKRPKNKRQSFKAQEMFWNGAGDEEVIAFGKKWTNGFDGFATTYKTELILIVTMKAYHLLGM